MACNPAHFRVVGFSTEYWKVHNKWPNHYRRFLRPFFLNLPLNKDLTKVRGKQNLQCLVIDIGFETRGWWNLHPFKSKLFLRYDGKDVVQLTKNQLIFALTWRQCVEKHNVILVFPFTCLWWGRLPKNLFTFITTFCCCWKARTVNFMRRLVHKKFLVKKYYPVYFIMLDHYYSASSSHIFKVK